MTINKEMYESVLRYFQKCDYLKEVFSSVITDPILVEKTIHNLYQSLLQEEVFLSFSMHLYTQYGPSFMDVIFTKENLEIIVRYLLERGLTLLQVQQVLVDNPGLLLLSFSLEKIMVVFRESKYYGIVISDGEDVYSYYALPLDLATPKDMLSRHPFSKNTYLLKTLRCFLAREDSCAFYSIEENDNLTSRLKKMQKKDCSNSGFHIR